MNTFIDHYCERVAFQLWGEPLNTVSNIAFFIVAFLIYRKQKIAAQSRPNWDLLILILLIVAVGTGSSLWHLLARHWALWADRVPILLFISLYFISCLARIFKLKIRTIVILFFMFHIINSMAQWYFPAGSFNGSLFYIPTLVFLAGITLSTSGKKYMTIRAHYFYALLFFITAIVFRTIDLPICDTISVGTHFIWHILVALTIYFLMLGLIKPTKASLSNNSNQ